MDDPYQFEFDVSLGDRHFSFKTLDEDAWPLPSEHWVRYEAAGGWTRPHLLDGFDDDGRALLACGLGVEPDRESAVTIYGPDGNELATAASLLAPVDRLVVYPGENMKSPACGVCFYEARKRRDAREAAWGLRQMSLYRGPLATVKFTGLT